MTQSHNDSYYLNLTVDEIENFDIVYPFLNGYTINNLLFRWCEYHPEVKSLNLTKWDVSKIKDMKYLFSDLYNLETIDITGWNTSNVTDMSEMFDECTSLKEIKGLSNLDVRNVVNMFSMFHYCKSLKEIDITEWNTCKLIDASELFEYCESLKEIKGLSNLDVRKVKYMSCMFNGCSSLEEIDITGWDASNIKNMTNMFDGCSSLKEIKGLSNLDVRKVKYMSCIFNGCSSLEEIDITGWNTCKVKNMLGMFCECESLKEIKGLSNLDVRNVQTMIGMFDGCSSLDEIDITGWNTHDIEDMGCMFNKCESLKEIKGLSNLDVRNAEDMFAMFRSCKSLKEIDIRGWKTGNVRCINDMFNKCESLKEIKGLSNLDVRNVQTTIGMFDGCSSLEEIDIRGWNTSNVRHVGYMFLKCESLKEIKGLSHLDTRNIEDIEPMIRSLFYECPLLNIIDILPFII